MLFLFNCLCFGHGNTFIFYFQLICGSKSFFSFIYNTSVSLFLYIVSSYVHRSARLFDVSIIICKIILFFFLPKNMIVLPFWIRANWNVFPRKINVSNQGWSLELGFFFCQRPILWVFGKKHQWTRELALLSIAIGLWFWEAFHASSSVFW